MRPEFRSSDFRFLNALRAVVLLAAAITGGLTAITDGRALPGASLALLGSCYVLLTTFSGVVQQHQSRHHIALTTCDILFITTIVWFTGAVQSEYYLLYYFPAISAGLRFDTRTGIASCLLGGLFYIFVALVPDDRQAVVTTTASRVITVCCSAIVLVIFFALLKRELQLYDSLRDATRRSLSRVAAIYDVAHAGNLASDSGDLVSLLLDHAARRTRAEHGSISLLTAEGQLQSIASLCPRSGALPVLFPSEPAAQALASAAPITITPDSPQAAADRISRSLLYLPLKTPAGPIGVLSLASQPAHRFTRTHLEFLESLCAEAAVTIENIQLRSELRRLAVTDPLTGLPNRREIEQRLLAESKRAQRYHRAFTLLVIDADNLKLVNDHCGHAAGDDVLCTLGRLLQSKLRASDSAGRIGGDEFMVILPETNAVQAALLADRIIETFAAALRTVPALRTAKKIAALVGLSIGAAEQQEDQLSPQELVARADAALYHAKRTGKNRCSTSPLPPHPPVPHTVPDEALTL